MVQKRLKNYITSWGLHVCFQVKTNMLLERDLQILSLNIMHHSLKFRIQTLGEAQGVQVNWPNRGTLTLLNSSGVPRMWISEGSQGQTCPGMARQGCGMQWGQSRLAGSTRGTWPRPQLRWGPRASAGNSHPWVGLGHHRGLQLSPESGAAMCPSSADIPLATGTLRAPGREGYVGAFPIHIFIHIITSQGSMALLKTLLTKCLVLNSQMFSPQDKD